MVNGLPQRLAITISLLLNIRIRARKGFRQALDADLAQRAPRMASGAIGHAVAGDGHQPGKEWALRIVGRAGNVKGKKDLLDNIFDVRRLKKVVSPLDRKSTRLNSSH